jgi:hypothetical protein
LTQEEIEVIKKALDEEEILTEFESQFINSLAEKPEDYRLSVRQIEILSKIDRKVFDW